jgi:hypothetical protein
MRDDELTELRERVDCRAVLERAGWELDIRDSTRGAAKYRQGAGRIVIVTHEGRGWFDPVNGGRGDVLTLAQYVWGGTLGHARKHLRPLAGIVPTMTGTKAGREAGPFDAAAQWRRGSQLRPGSQAWAYLSDKRGLPPVAIHRAITADVFREGIYGTVWAMHQAAGDRITGWEMRGPNYKGFSKGGGKALFRVGNPDGVSRVAITESAIDTLSLATIENWVPGTLYVSTGGGWGPDTEAALRVLLQPPMELVAATDQGAGGELLAKRLAALAADWGTRFGRLLPTAKDWNDQLRDEGG